MMLGQGKSVEFLPVSANYVFDQALISKIRTANGVQVLNPSAPVTIPQANSATPSIFPPSLNTLPLETVNVYVLNRDVAVNLGYLTASAGGNNSLGVIVESWRKSVQITIGNDANPYLYGVAINFVTRVSTADGGANTGNLLKAVSASASFRKLKATVSAEVIGLSSRAITTGLPTSAEMLRRYEQLLSRDPKEVNALPGAMLLASVGSDSFETVRNQVWNIFDSSANATTAASIGYQPQIVGVSRP